MMEELMKEKLWWEVELGKQDSSDPYYGACQQKVADFEAQICVMKAKMDAEKPKKKKSKKSK